MRRFVSKLSICACVAAPPAYAIDGCLVGVWEADAVDMAAVMQDQMGSAVSYKSGRVSVEITEFGVMTMLAENLIFSVAVPNIPPVDVELVGYSQGAMNADDGSNFLAVAAEYSLVGSADVLGQRMEIPVTTADAGWGNARGTYTCTGNSVTLRPSQPGSYPRKLTRVR